MKTHAFPLLFRTRITRAIRVPFSSDRMDRQYRHATFALHQHHYVGRVEIDGEMFPLQPGDITLTPPQVISRYELENAGHHWCIHFNVVPVTDQNSPTDSFAIPLHIRASSGSTAIGEEMQAIHDITRYPAHTSEEIAMVETAAGTRLSALLLHIGLRTHAGRERDGTSRHLKSDSAMDAARERLERDFTKPIGVAQLVEASGLSPHYFAARFQKRFGVTVNTYLLNLRLEMARHLLLATDLPIKEVAFECGIPDPQYFNKQFRKSTGVSPSEYRGRGTGSV